MDKKINFNGLRALVKNTPRPMLTGLHVNGNTGWVTDSYTAVEMKGFYTGEAGTTRDLFNLKELEGTYPKIWDFVRREYNPVTFEPDVLDGEVIYAWPLKDRQYRRLYIDQEILKNLKKLIAIKGHKVDHTKIEIAAGGRAMAKYQVFKDEKEEQEINIYFITKVRDNE